MAVKVVEKARPAGELDDRLLRREVEIGRRVADAGSALLLPVIDVAEMDDRLLLVMARADRALADISLPVDDDAAIAVMTDIVTGLQQLHAIGVIHRDLKPANVLRHADRWKLADFGIARDEEIGTQNPTFVGWGSPPYMAPELWETKSPTVKTDLYALGCVGFEMLSGRAPYAGDRAAVRNAHLAEQVPETPTANVVLRNLIARLLAKDPGSGRKTPGPFWNASTGRQCPRNPVQEAIAHGLGGHAAERSQEASRRAAQKAGADAHQQQIGQAQADLVEIVADAFEDLQQIEPGVTLQSPAPGQGRYSIGARSITLATDAARLRIDLWDEGAYGAVSGDSMLLASAVIITNRRYNSELNAANLIYEQIGDRLGWQIYRFRIGMVRPDSYPYGPYGRTHGLSHQDFFGQWGRYFMVHPAMHTWQKEVSQLTPETLLGIFQDAVELRPPDRRTGLWPTA